MRNIDKLVKFLVTDADKDVLSKSTATDLESVSKFCGFMIDRILPEDFLIQEGSHIEEKDLNSLVRNFNSLLQEENLKLVLVDAIKATDVKPNQATVLASNLLPIIHEKIKVLMGNRTAESEVSEDAEVEETPVKEKKRLSFFQKKNEEEAVEEVVQQSETAEEKASSVEALSDETLNKIDLIAMIVVGVCFVAIIGVLMFILIKVNLG